MKIPLLWLKDYVEIDKPIKDIADSFTKLGLMLDKPLENTEVLDLEHRLDRSDWLSILGCTRDLAAFENISLKDPKLYSKPGKTPDPKSVIKINVDTPHVRRFNTRVFRGVNVKESPAWLIERLQAYGISPINNIVDITNFVMVELGQPMHAQDISKLKSPEITLRQAKDSEKLKTLLGTEIKLDQETFVLSSGGVPTVIGGIVGGQVTGVTNETTDIIVDAGNYDQSVIRKTSRRLKIINETVARYDKYLDPRLTEIALQRAAGLILEIAGGTYYDNTDYYPNPVTPQNMQLTYKRLALISGLTISQSTVKRILKSLGYQIVEETEETLTLEIPLYRTDIEVEDDLIADILRINNYNNLPALPLSTPVPADITPTIYHFEDRLRDLLSAQGAHEHITTPLVKSAEDPSQIILSNALSSEQNALRTSLVPHLKKVLTNYRKHNRSNTIIFELGNTFHQSIPFPHERRELTVCSNSQVNDQLDTLLHNLSIRYYLTKDFSVMVDNIKIGELSKESFTLYSKLLAKFAQEYQPIISEFSHPIFLDISLLAPNNLQFADIQAVINSLTFHWEKIVCKKYTELGNGLNNYLLQITWPSNSTQVKNDKELLLKELKDKLGITSKS